MDRTLYHATAVGPPRPAGGGRFMVVEADTTEGRRRLVVKPTRDEQRRNPAWAFNEFVAGRFAASLGVDSPRPYVLHGLPDGPLVGVPYQEDIRHLEDLLRNPGFSWDSVSNFRVLLEIAAFDLCVCNSDREPVNLFLLPQGGSSKLRLVAYDHEKSLAGDGRREGDRHRMQGRPVDKNLGNFIRPWLRRQLRGGCPAAAPAARIAESAGRFAEILPQLWRLVSQEVPESWLDAVPLRDLSDFLPRWWGELPRLCAERLEAVLHEKPSLP